MKKVFLMLSAVMITCLAYAQKNKEIDVPAVVKTAFQKQYPTAKDVEWEMENGRYEAEFELGKTENSVVFDVQGNILETEVQIKVSQLPAGVAAYVKTNYAGKKIKEAAKITNANGTVTYEAEVKKKDLIFDSNGKFIKEETEDSKNSDD